MPVNGVRRLGQSQPSWPMTSASSTVAHATNIPSPSGALGGAAMIAAKQKMWNSDPAGRMWKTVAQAAASRETMLVRMTFVHNPARVPCGITDEVSHAPSMRLQKVPPALSWAIAHPRGRRCW